MRREKELILNKEEALVSMNHLKHRKNSVILLVDHDVDFVTEVRGRLEEEGFHTIIALSIEKANTLYEMLKPDFVLVNLQIQHSEREDVKEFIKDVHESYIPIAVVSDINTLEERILAYQLGATDFIGKDIIHPDWFIAYLHNRLNHQKGILIDELTGAYNRKYMEQLLEDMLKNYGKNQDIFSVILLDLDHFKQVNDQYGHVVGDEVLQKLVEVVEAQKRKIDYICRFGGEEFLFLLPGSSVIEAKEVVEVIRKKFSKIEFKTEKESFRVTFSAGITEVHSNIETKEELIDEADRALYQCKEQGRNCSIIYSEHQEAMRLHRLHIIIVDDNKLVRTMLEESFKQWEFDKSVDVFIQTYEDGVEFLNSDWYEPTDKYMILLDGLMPRMDGFDVLKKVREIYPPENITISMLSARTSEKFMIQALRKGADDYMLKPFRTSEVTARVSRLAKRLLF